MAAVLPGALLLARARTVDAVKVLEDLGPERKFGSDQDSPNTQSRGAELAQHEKVENECNPGVQRCILHVPQKNCTSCSDPRAHPSVLLSAGDAPRLSRAALWPSDALLLRDGDLRGRGDIFGRIFHAFSAKSLSFHSM